MSATNADYHPGGVAYATDTLTAQRGFYGQNFGWGFNILLCISTQMMGYGLAGIFRKVLVWPGKAILPHPKSYRKLFLTGYSGYDLAYYVDQHRSVLRSPRSVKNRPRKVQRLEHLPLQILLHRLCLFLLLVLVSRLHRTVPERLRIRRLDPPQQRRDQPAVWRMDWRFATANHL